MSKTKDFNRNFAIVIGINNYQNGMSPLETAAPDAEKLAQILKEQHSGLKEKYQKGHKYEVQLLLNEEATLDKLKQLIEDFKNEQIPLDHEKVKVGKDDRVLFYFAGHGIAGSPLDSPDGPVGYLLPQDATSDHNTHLPMQELHEALLKLPCRHMLVILDCCFAGAFRWATLKRDIERKVNVYKERFDRFISDPAWQVITSAGDDQKALDCLAQRGTASGSNHSPFAQALFDALRGEVEADGNKDGIITASELYSYLRDKVEPETEKLFQRQTPNLCSFPKRHGKGEFIFLLPNFDRDKLADAPSLNWENNPYLGLRSYDKEDSDLFFGRENRIQELYQRVLSDKQALTVVLGVSGTGKSSLMKAGLLHRLCHPEKDSKKHQFEVLGPLRPGENPLNALAQVFLSIKDETAAKELADIKKLSEKLRADQQALVKIIQGYNKIQPDPQLLQAVEQLELTDDQLKSLKTLSKSNEQQIIIKWIDNFEKRKELGERIKKPIEDLIKELEADAQAWITIIKNWIETHPNVKLVLAIDQFEELITLRKIDTNKKRGKNQKNDRNTEQQQFQKLIKEAISTYPAQFHVVVTLRLDFEAQFQDDVLKDFWKDARFVVPLMTHDELREAIEKPAQEKVVYFDPPKLVDTLINEVGQMPGALPLLSFTLSELYIKYVEERRDNRALTEKDYDDLGRIVGSLTKRADKEYEKLVKEDDAYQHTVRRVMLRMVAVGDELARRRVLWSELDYPDDQENNRANRVIEQFCNARLLVKGTNSEGKTYVEPAHDALVQGWQKLLHWKNQEQQTLVLQRRLTPVANDWKDRKDEEDQARSQSCFGRVKSCLIAGESFVIETMIKTDSFVIKIVRVIVRKAIQIILFWRSQEQLLSQDDSQNLSRKSIGYLWNTDPRLPQLQQVRDSNDNWFNATEDTFVRQSLIKKKKNAVLLGLGVRVGLIAGMGLVGWALWGYRQAKLGEISTSRESAETNLKLNRDLEAMVDILRAGKPLNFNHLPFNPFNLAFPKEEARVRATLFKVFDKVKERNRFQLDRGSIYQVAFNPKKDLLATVGDGDTVRLWDTSGKQLEQFPTHQEDVYSIVFSPDGTLLATGGADGTIKFWKINQEDGTVEYNSSEESSVAPQENKSGGTGGTPTPESIGTGETPIPQKQLTQPTNVQRQESCKLETGTQKIFKSVTFNSDGKQLATIVKENLGDKIVRTVKLWNIQGSKCTEKNISNTALGKEGQETKSPNSKELERVYDVAFRPKSNLLATLGEGDKVKLWDSTSGKLLKPIETQQKNVQRVAFTPDGKLATAGEDGMIKLWDINQDGKVENISDKKPREITTKAKTVYSMAFNSDGTQLATVGEDSAVRLLDLNILGKESPVIQPTQGTVKDIRVKSIAFSPDGKQLATIGGDASIRLWDTSGNQIARFQTGGGTVNSVAFSPDGKLLAIGKQDGEISLWDTSNYEESDETSLEQLQESLKSAGNSQAAAATENRGENESSSPKSVRNVIFKFDGKQLAIISEDGSIRLLSIEHKKFTEKDNSHLPLVKQFQTDLGHIKSLVFSSSGEQWATVGKDNTVKLWENNDQFKTISTPTQQKKVNSVAFSPDGKLLAIGGNDDTLRLWDISKKKEADDLQFQTQQGHIDSVAFSPLDSRQLVTGGEDGTVKVWNLSSNNPAQFSTEQGSVKSIAFSPDGKLLVTVGQNKLKLWDIKDDSTLSLRNISNTALDQFQMHKGSVKSVAFTLGNQLATVGKDDKVMLWDISGKKLDQIETKQQGITSVVFSRDGKLLTTFGKDNTEKLWNFNSRDGKLTSKDISKSGLGKSSFKIGALSPDGQQLATTAGKKDGTVKLWKTLSGKQGQEFQTQQEYISSVAFNPADSEQLAIAAKDGTLNLWDTSGNLVKHNQTQQEQEHFNSVAFSPDGKQLATIDNKYTPKGILKSTLKLWDASDKELNPIMSRESESVESVAFSPDGKRLAIGKKDGTVRLWRVDMDDLWVQSCNLVRDYLKNNPNLSDSDRHLCDDVPEPGAKGRISHGDKLLVPSVTNPDKQTGIEAIADGDFKTAIKSLETSLKTNRNDPEARIYLNNARIGTHKSYTIAVSVPFGSNEDGALEVLRGVAQAQDEINQKGGINGVPLRVLIANDDNNTEAGKQIAEEFGKNSDVLGVVGHYASDVTIAAGEKYQANKLVAISPVSTSTQWFNLEQQVGQYIFRTVSKNNVAATAMTNYMQDTLHQEKAVVFYNAQSDYSRSLSDEFSSAISSKGGQVLKKFDLSNPTFDANKSVDESIKLKANVLVLISNTEEMDNALQVVKVNNGQLSLLAGDAFYRPNTLEAAKEKNNDLGMVIAVPWHIAGKSQSKFSDDSKKLWGGDVSWRTATSYDASAALIAALKQNPTRDGVAQALQSDKFTADGATGKVQFEHSGDRNTQVSQLVKIKPGSRSGYGYDFVPVP